MVERVEVGSQAPDFEYTRADGTRASLSDVWSDEPAFVVWLRHCG